MKIIKEKHKWGREGRKNKSNNRIEEEGRGKIGLVGRGKRNVGIDGVFHRGRPIGSV